MSVSVTPGTFTFVSFDARLIEQIAEQLVDALGLRDRNVTIHVDETTPLTRTRVDVGETIVIHADSGAFEDTRRPRTLSKSATATSLGRLLLRARDRLDGRFAGAPPDDQLTLPQIAGWDAYCAGRLQRVGVAMNQQRWRYNFRNRHGFVDAVDEAFDRLWASDDLSWAELDEVLSRS